MKSRAIFRVRFPVEEPELGRKVLAQSALNAALEYLAANHTRLKVSGVSLKYSTAKFQQNLAGHLFCLVQIPVSMNPLGPMRTPIEIN